MLKKNSEAWKIATRIAKRKGANRMPIALAADGQSVEFMSTIRGNKWTRTLPELRLIAKR